MKTNYIAALSKILISGLSVGLLLGCSSTSDKLKPADLGSNQGLLNASLVWTANIGNLDFQLQPKAIEQSLLLVNSTGLLVSLNTANGAQSLISSLGEKISSGLGASSDATAVVTRSNELIMTLRGREVWRQKMLAQVFTSPLVAGGRVFVLAADRSVSAFDAETGRRLWLLQRPGESLVLRQPGVLLAVGDTLVAGLSGQLVSINSINGAISWETPIASPRGTNEIERLVDLVGPVSRDGNIVCSRAFQSAVGCVDTSSGNLMWSKPASGSVGLGGDNKFVYGTESDGKVVAWRRATGEVVWVSDHLKFRRLTAPLYLGRSIALGDDQGNVHFVSAVDGSPLAYLKTDGSAVVAGPILAGGMLVVVTRNGGVFGIKPE
jgi:outer membrane assembly lipoprotein YfgL